MRGLELYLTGLLCVFVTLTHFTTASVDGADSGDRQAKFFPFFIGPTVVRVPNDPCKGENGLAGTCYTRQQCSSSGGTSSGTCARGMGVCCIAKKTCGEWTKTNCTYFMNPEYPDSCKLNNICHLSVWKISGACQLRIDFLDFKLANPDANGRCANDFMLVTGGASSVPRICGLNTGEHVYVDFPVEGPIDISIDTNSALSIDRRWKLKLTQVKCCDRAPVGCLMYYTATSGKVMSFDYSPTVSPATDPAIGSGTRELPNLNYGVCVQMAPGYCSIEWSQSANDPFSFTVSGDTDVLDNIALGTTSASVVGENCTTDYIVIPSPSINGIPVNYDRFCGNGFPTVTSSSKPFVMTVITNGDELGPPPDVANRGFCLNYRQLPCVQ